MLPILRPENKVCAGYRISGVINFVQGGGAGQFLAVDNMNNIFASSVLLNTAPFTVIIVRNIWFKPCIMGSVLSPGRLHVCIRIRAEIKRKRAVDATLISGGCSNFDEFIFFCSIQINRCSHAISGIKPQRNKAITLWITSKILKNDFICWCVYDVKESIGKGLVVCIGCKNFYNGSGKVLQGNYIAIFKSSIRIAAENKVFKGTAKVFVCTFLIKFVNLDGEGFFF